MGEHFEISFNSYKPFACGIVIHPSIDACAQLRAKGVRPEQVQRIDLRVHSLVLELTGKKNLSMVCKPSSASTTAAQQA